MKNHLGKKQIVRSDMILMRLADMVNYKHHMYTRKYAYEGYSKERDQ
jgi:hypothetical protein